MEYNEALLPQTEIDSALNNILNDISNMLKEHCESETVRASIEVKFELTKEQISLLPGEVQENLKTPKRIPLNCRMGPDGHIHCTVIVAE